MSRGGRGSAIVSGNHLTRMGAWRRRRRTERVTLARVAEEAGVSLSTISKVLNGRTDVSEATRARVEGLLGPMATCAATPVRRRARLIELVFHELESAWSMEIIKGVEDIATQNGMSVVLTESGSRHAPGPEWIEGVMRRRPVGVVLVFSDLPTDYRAMLSRGRSRSSSSIRPATPRPTSPPSDRPTGRAG